MSAMHDEAWTTPTTTQLRSHVTHRLERGHDDAAAPGPVPSLTGRAHQRFEGDRRLVCGCVAFRVDEFADAAAATADQSDVAAAAAAAPAAPASSGATQLSVLLVRSKKKDEWIFPKGGWEQFESASECATRECLEEAGAEGVVLCELGPVDFASKKGKRSRMHPFLLQVTELHRHWAEETERKRRWVHMADMEATLLRAETRTTWQEARKQLQALGFIDERGQAIFKAPPPPTTAATTTQAQTQPETAAAAAATNGAREIAAAQQPLHAAAAAAITNGATPSSASTSART